MISPILSTKTIPKLSLSEMIGMITALIENFKDLEGSCFLRAPIVSLYRKNITKYIQEHCFYDIDIHDSLELQENAHYLMKKNFHAKFDGVRGKFRMEITWLDTFQGVFYSCYQTTLISLASAREIILTLDSILDSSSFDESEFFFEEIGSILRAINFSP